MPRKKDIYFAAETGLEFQAANEMHTEGRHGTHRWKGRRFDPHSLGEEPPPPLKVVKSIGIIACLG